MTHRRLGIELSGSVGLDLRSETGPLRRRPCLRMFCRQRRLVAAKHVGQPPVRRLLVPRGGLIDGKVGRRHQRVRMILAERTAAFDQYLLTKLDRSA